MRIRLADPDDAERIAVVHAESRAYLGVLSNPVIEQIEVERVAVFWRRILESGNRQLLVAETPPLGVVGFCHLIPSRDSDAAPETCEVSALYVHPDRWRQGIGTALLREVLILARRRQCKGLTLWVLESNDLARAFYAARGFGPDGALKWKDFGGVSLQELRYALPL